MKGSTRANLMRPSRSQVLSAIQHEETNGPMTVAQIAWRVLYDLDPALAPPTNSAALRLVSRPPLARILTAFLVEGTAVVRSAEQWNALSALPQPTTKTGVPLWASTAQSKRWERESTTKEVDA